MSTNWVIRLLTPSKNSGLLWIKTFISLQLIRHLVLIMYIDHTITNFIKTTELKNKGKKFTKLIYRKGNISQTLSPIVHLTNNNTKNDNFYNFDNIYLNVGACVWILINLPLNYIICVHSPHLKNLKMIKD